MSYDGLVYYLIMVGVIGCDNFCVTKMEYIMYIMFKIILFFLITLFFRIYVSVNIFLTCGKYLHDRIISLRREILAHKTSLPPPPFIEVLVLSHESERSCICVLEVMYLCVRGHVFVC